MTPDIKDQVTPCNCRYCRKDPDGSRHYRLIWEGVITLIGIVGAAQILAACF